MKYCSIILVHYSMYDDFGGLRAKELCSEITRKETLRITIESLKENTKYPYELIVIDNGGNNDDTDYLVEKVREGVINILIRNKDNMHFAYGRNQGLMLATGDYICITDNDIKFYPNWLTTCIENLDKYDRKLIATPLITPDKDTERFERGELDGNRINAMAGSCCFVVRKKDMKKLGTFTHNQISGSRWHQAMHERGYLVIAPPKDMAEHLGIGGGLAMGIAIKVEKTLSTGDKVNFRGKPWHINYETDS